jgi:putative MATE family efflux protein
MTAQEKHHKKMTETPVAKLIIMLGIPTTISMLITNIYNLVDTYFVGNLGESAQGATGILFTLQAIIQAIAFMLGHGSGTFVAKALADKDNEEATTYISTAFYIGLGFGTILTVFGLIFIKPLMLLLGSTDTILPYAIDYGLWVLISAPFLIASMVLNNNLRYEGKAFFSMIGLCAGAILNIFGDYIFIMKFNLGVFGAGMSTAISQIISFIILLVLYIKYAQSKIRINAISKDMFLYLDIFKVGLPSLIRQGLTSISGGILNNLSKPYGDACIAAMTIVNRYSSFVLCVGLGIGQGFQPVASFNYQTKDYTRVKKGLVFTTVFGTVLIASIATIGFILAPEIVYLFQKSEKVIEIGTFALRAASIGALFLPVSVAANMLYQSIRKAGVASFLALLRSGLALIPTLLILSNSYGIIGIQISQPISDAISCLISLPFFILFLIKTPNTEKKCKYNFI